MNPAANIDLTELTQAYAVANTPLFFVRKLREDSAISEYGRHKSGNDILSDLRDALARAPSGVEDYVRPYAYLMALTLKHDAEYLKQIPELTEVQRWSWDWFEYIHHVLLETQMPLINQNSKIRPPHSEGTKELDGVPTNHQTGGV